MRGFGSRFGRRRRYEELSASIEEHLAEKVDELMESGLSREEAMYAARRAFGNAMRIEERSREVWQWPRIESICADAKFALRQMKKSPGFAATVIGILGLGIGAAAAMFTVVDHVLLRPVPYRDPGQLVQISEANKSGRNVGPQVWLDIEQWREQSRSFEGIGLWIGETERNFVEQGTSAFEVSSYGVSPNLLPLLGVQPTLGRDFLQVTPGFGPDKNAGTVLLSYPAWQALGGSRNILGRKVLVNNTPRTVVGVMPREFRYPAETQAGGAFGMGKGTPQVWTPIELGKGDAARSTAANGYFVLARLRSGVKLGAAQAEMAAIQQRLGQEWPTGLPGGDHSHIKVQRYTDTLVDAALQKGLLALLSASGVLWLIAGLNVTNLLLARGTARQREMAMRRALGASRWRVARQMMVEGLALSVAAGTLGIGLAATSVRVLGHEIRLHLPLPVPARPDASIVVILVGLTVASALLSTAWPALAAARTPLEPMLKQGSQQTGQSRRHHRTRGALVVLEVAMSLTLLMACGLFLRTIYALEHVPLGFRTDHIVVADLDIPAYRYAHRNLTTELYEPLVEQAQHLHGVESAGLMTEVPLGQTLTTHIEMALNGRRRVAALFKAASPGAQQVFGFRMAAGRFFDSGDIATSRTVVVVNEAFARAYSPDKHDPAAILGTKLMGTDRGASQAEYAVVTGVLRDEHQASINEDSRPELDLCVPQLTPKSLFYTVMDGIAMDLAVRTGQPPETVIPEVRDMLRRADPQLAAARITTMTQVVEDSYGNQRLASHLLEIFGGSALLLCIAGLYGLLAYVVNQRTREMGVRIALGAQRADVLWLVMRQAGAMLLAGVAVGSGMALASGRLVQGFLYGVKAHDGWTLAGAAVVLFASGMVAAWLPARRAASVDPMQALRTE